ARLQVDRGDVRVLAVRRARIREVRRLDIEDSAALLRPLGLLVDELAVAGSDPRRPRVVLEVEGVELMSGAVLGDEIAAGRAVRSVQPERAVRSRERPLRR